MFALATIFVDGDLSYNIAEGVGFAAMLLRPERIAKSLFVHVRISLTYLCSYRRRNPITHLPRQHERRPDSWILRFDAQVRSDI